MRLSVSLFPLRANQIVDVAVLAESLGFDGVWIGEHVISPIAISSRYPYASDDGDRRAYHAHLPFYDPYAALAFVAARTTVLRLGLALSIVPLHDPFHLARSVATLDLFSEGRFRFGVGAGWLREEFEIVGQPWSDRGARMEEALQLMTCLWNDHEPAFAGRFYTLPPAAMEPKPRTLPHPPFVFGGTTPIALDRAARLGDGWIGVGVAIDQVAGIIAELHRLRDEHGRSADPFEMSMIVAEPPDRSGLERLAQAGVHETVVRPWIRGRDAVANLRAYAASVGLVPG